MDIKTYLADASTNLKQILHEQAYVNITKSGDVTLDGTFTAEELEKIIVVLAEVKAGLAEIEKANANHQTD